MEVIILHLVLLYRVVYAGFASVEAAERCEHFECQVCACSRLANRPKTAAATTLIVVPFNLIGQVYEEK